MTNSTDFDVDYNLEDFTPYLLNLAAETASLAFQQHYKPKYGMLRTEWRVLFHLGQYGPMHAKDICARARIHKTKVSRAVAALEQKRYLKRSEASADRRHDVLALTKSGQGVFQDLYRAARIFEADLISDFSDQEQAILKTCLTRIARIPS